MSQENAVKESSPVAPLFQKAHTKMVMLQRVESQFTSLNAQRKMLQEELRTLQVDINAELSRLTEAELAPMEMPAESTKKSKRSEGRGGSFSQAAAA